MGLKLIFVIALLLGVAAVNADRVIDPVADRTAFQLRHQQRFPTVALNDFVQGVYAIDPALKAQADEINAFPPHEFAVDEGKILFETQFGDGASLADCFPQAGVGISQRFPRFDDLRGEVVTLALAVNECREAHNEPPLAWGKGPLAAILGYMVQTSAGEALSANVGADRRARDAYALGKQFFYSKRGQLNFSCANCHLDAMGKHLRAQTLGPLLGVVNHFPVYSLRWGSLGTLHQRFAGCLDQVRAKPLALQSIEFRNLEYFLAVMSHGLPIYGPSSQR